ncbi:HECT-like Ubiquitin-conjugating enzyme (E2)-binding [Popillia japonica]|uniref:E3 ubiquitin-protein ligase E3D n=1 Tax=Popillia japonica TaxID=7064 RepID=A0AAW1K045_POPJA
MSEVEIENFHNDYLIEIRPRLQSVNVLVNLKRQLKSPQISLSSDSIYITEDIVFKVPCKKLKIVYNSLNNVQITDKFISFRFSTTNDGFGSFKSEILQLENCNDSIVSKFYFGNNSSLKIQCGNCLQIFSENNFKRILPLPSEHSEPSDWFCHNHGNKDETVNNNTLDPQESDFFYSICYCHLNSKLLKGCLKSAPNLVCRRCLAWIGIILNDISFKVWFNTVQISDNVKILKSSALNDTILTIKSILKDSLLTSARIILRCQINKTQIDYLLLWVIEKKLNIVINKSLEEFNDLFVAKILFKFQSGTNNIEEHWFNDITVSNVDISKLMMVEILKHLYKMNKILPKEWSSSNDFYISYLPLYDDSK